MFSAYGGAVLQSIQAEAHSDVEEERIGTTKQREMSISEHLSSMPLPWAISQNDTAGMLNMGALGPPSSASDAVEGKKQTCNGSPVLSSNQSSSSCSPAAVSPQIESIRQMRIQQNDRHNVCSELDRVVGVMLPLQDMMKPEPPLDVDYMHAMQSRLASQHCHMSMPLHLSFNRCSEGAIGSVSSSDDVVTPAPTRRTRSASDGMLKCQFCPKKWINERALHLHMSDCRMIRSHECAQCGKRFKARGGLQQHMRIHSNDRPYSCHFCSKRFTQKSHLDQHERIHTGAKPFSCQFCGRAFRQRSQQLGHEATHTNHSGGTTLTSSGASSSAGIRSEEASRTSPDHSPRNDGGLNSLGVAAAMMQHNQLPNELLGHIENTRGMMESLSSDQLLALSQPHNTSISTLLGLHGEPNMSAHHHVGDFSMQHAVGLINGLH